GGRKVRVPPPAAPRPGRPARPRLLHLLRPARVGRGGSLRRRRRRRVRPLPGGRPRHAPLPDDRLPGPPGVGGQVVGWLGGWRVDRLLFPARCDRHKPAGANPQAEALPATTHPPTYPSSQARLASAARTSSRARPSSARKTAVKKYARSPRRTTTTSRT